MIKNDASYEILDLMARYENEHIKEIFKNILYFIVGVLIVAVPVCLFSFTGEPV